MRGKAVTWLTRVWKAIRVKLFPTPAARVEGWIATILLRQRGDADDKMKASSYWGDTGGCVAKAVFRASSAITLVAMEPDLHA